MFRVFWFRHFRSRFRVRVLYLSFFFNDQKVRFDSPTVSSDNFLIRFNYKQDPLLRRYFWNSRKIDPGVMKHRMQLLLLVVPISLCWMLDARGSLGLLGYECSGRTYVHTCLIIVVPCTLTLSIIFFNTDTSKFTLVCDFYKRRTSFPLTFYGYLWRGFHPPILTVLVK